MQKPLRKARADVRLAPTRHMKGWGPSGRGMDPRVNRRSGEPHQHRREIARRLRQAARA